MKIFPTCSLCIHFDPNDSVCTLLNTATKAMDQEKPSQCVKNGHFVRDINVVLESYHQFAVGEPVPFNYKVDLSRLPKDDDGIPLFVMTKRGMERAIPAYPGLNLKGDLLLGVHKSLTYQGQRELIADLGVEVALEVANGRNVELIVLEDELGAVGKEEEIQRFRMYQKPSIRPKDSWAASNKEQW